MELKLLTINNAKEVVYFARLLNANYTPEYIQECLQEMFSFNNYYLFGLYDEGDLVAISSAWLTLKFYSGRQLEVDNVVVTDAIRSKGYGAQLMQMIEAWSKEKGCVSVELNSYVTNARSHKFYTREGYDILGFHFVKKMKY